MATLTLTFYGYKTARYDADGKRQWYYHTRLYALKRPEDIELPESAELLYAYILAEWEIVVDTSATPDVHDFDGVDYAGHWPFGEQLQDAVAERCIHYLTLEVFDTVNEAYDDYKGSLIEADFHTSYEFGREPVPWVLKKCGDVHRVDHVWTYAHGNQVGLRGSTKLQKSEKEDQPPDDVDHLFEPSKRNAYEEIDGFGEEPYLRAQRAACAIAKYMGASEPENVGTRRLEIKDLVFQATTFRFKKGIRTCKAEFSVPISFQGEDRLWTTNTEGSRVWATTSAILSAHFQEELFSYLGGYFGDFGLSSDSDRRYDASMMGVDASYSLENSPFPETPPPSRGATDTD